MRTRLASLLATAVVAPALVVLGTTSTAGAADTDVCDKFGAADHLKPQNSTEKLVVTVKAPAGKLISGYCVKSGSTNQGLGPRYFDLTPPATSVTFSYPTDVSGKAKDISHYSIKYVAATPKPTTPAPTTPEPTIITPSATAPTTTPTTTPTQPEPTTPAPTTPAPSTSAGPEPTEPEPTEVLEPAEPVVPVSPQNPPATDGYGNFNWNWRYTDPSCYALLVAYPSNIPEGQSNDINVRVWTDVAGEITLNYHNNEGTWSGTRAFAYAQHKNWPAGVKEYAVVWTQVAGSNYHYGEKFHQEPAKAPLTCRINDDGDPETYDLPQAISDIEGWRTSTVSVRKGSTAPADSVTVEHPGLETVTLERLRSGTWSTVKTVVPGSRTTTVTFPKETRRGRFQYRLVLPGSGATTGATTETFTVRVR